MHMASSEAQYNLAAHTYKLWQVWNPLQPTQCINISVSCSVMKYERVFVGKETINNCCGLFRAETDVQIIMEHFYAMNT